MSRLRRLVLCDRFFFVTCKVYPGRRHLGEPEFTLLASANQSRRRTHRFLLTAWVFLPDHWHAFLCPTYPTTISLAMESIKVSSARQINKLRRQAGLLFRPSRADGERVPRKGGIHSGQPVETRPSE